MTKNRDQAPLRRNVQFDIFFWHIEHNPVIQRIICSQFSQRIHSLWCIIFHLKKCFS